MPYQSHRDPRVPYALMDDSSIGDGMRRRAEEALRRWKEMDERQFQMQREAERLEAEANDLLRQLTSIEAEWAPIWRELGLPFP